MLKKISVALAASAFALTLAAPVASACPGMKSKTVHKKKDKEEGVVAKKDEAKKDKKTDAKKTKKPVTISKK